MSAFQVTDEHIKLLAVFAASNVRGHIAVDPRYLPYEGNGARYPQAVINLRDTELATAYANILMAENVRSVCHRYRDADESEPLTVDIFDMADPRYTEAGALVILKSCDCLEYQSCECDDYRSTAAFDLCNRIRNAAISALPGYDSAPWGYDPGPRTRVVHRLTDLIARK